MGDDRKREMRIDHYLHSDGHDQTVALLKQILVNQGKIMHTIDEVKADIQGFKDNVAQYVAGRDAADAVLKQQLADAVAQAGQAMSDLSQAQADTAAANAARDALQAGVDDAFAAAEEAKGLLTPPAPPSDTGGGDGTGTGDGGVPGAQPA